MAAEKQIWTHCFFCDGAVFPEKVTNPSRGMRLYGVIPAHVECYERDLHGPPEPASAESTTVRVAA
jgi:hypothetical protein